MRDNYYTFTNCLMCKKSFKFPSRRKNVKFCSQNCYHSYTVGKKHPMWNGGQVYRITCKQCKKIVTRNRLHLVYCSHKCYSESKKGIKRYPDPSLSPAWKGGRHISSGGYINVRFPGKYVGEHRILMETKLGRKLLKSEHVHHINGIRTDNRLENLIVLTASEHMAHHHPRKKFPRPCICCSGMISNPKRQTTKFCSMKCKIAYSSTRRPKIGP